MIRRALRPLIAVAAVAALAVYAFPQPADPNDPTQEAMHEAAVKVGPSVVRIETSGGQDTIVWVDPATRQPIRKVVGPTTGLVVDADGYVITSSFNFSNKPTDIFVSVPGKGRSVAKVVGTDESRMLTLLKTDIQGLPVPTPTPKKEMQVGQWSIGLGRSLDPNLDNPPSISAGIISALGRIWGKAIQTDAKISPNNYGGPLVAIDGRVQGVLVPASPNSEGENAGIEWYDSGIGFAIPLEDILAVVPKLKQGTPEKPVTLRGGLLGITPKNPDTYGPLPIIGTVAPESAASKIGLKPDDQILEIDGKPTLNQAQVLHLLKPKYEGDTISLKVKRGDKELSFDKVTLQGSQSTLEQGYLGILPIRDDPEPGLEIRYVYPNSPADKAGLKAGDRIMQVGTVGPKPQMVPFSGRDQFARVMTNFLVNAEMNLQVKRQEGKVETLKVRLTALPDEVANELPKPEEASKKKALERPKPVGKAPPKKDAKVEPKKEQPKGKVDTGLLHRKNAAQGREYWVYVPRTYDPNVSHGLVIWLHPGGRQGRDAEDMTDIWADFCEDYNLIMLGPISKNNEGWAASEAEFIIGDLQEVLGQYTIDRQRIVAHGTGIGGQMAFYLAFYNREHIRGVAAHGSVLANQPKDPVVNQRQQFFISVGNKDPLAKDIADSKPKLVEKKYSVVMRVLEDVGKQYPHFSSTFQ
jgi:serine protease Do